MADMENADLLDYEDEEQVEAAEGVNGNGTNGAAKKDVKGTYVSIHSSGFRDFLLKPEVLKAISDCGFEHPSEVQHECIPQAVLGMDILCQAKSGMGKTAVFVLSILHQLDFEGDKPQCMVLCHTRELAFQITKEFERLGKYFLTMKTETLYGGVPVQAQRDRLSQDPPHIVVGTPGRVLDLVKSSHLKLDKLKFFVLDECDKMLEQLGESPITPHCFIILNPESVADMRRDVQEIFRATPHEKQVMMFSATLSKDIRPVCKKFMQDVRPSTALKSPG